MQQGVTKIEPILIASKNPSKIKWIKSLLQAIGLKGVSFEEAGVPQLTIRETGRTPEENALIKASAYQQANRYDHFRG